MVRQRGLRPYALRAAARPDLEYHAWPPRRAGGQHTGVDAGVLVVDRRTGVAVVVDSERSQRSNLVLAEERIRLLLAHLPWELEPKTNGLC